MATPTPERARRERLASAKRTRTAPLNTPTPTPHHSSFGRTVRALPRRAVVSEDMYYKGASVSYGDQKGVIHSLDDNHIVIKTEDGKYHRVPKSNVNVGAAIESKQMSNINRYKDFIKEQLKKEQLSSNARVVSESEKPDFKSIVHTASSQTSKYGSVLHHAVNAVLKEKGLHNDYKAEKRVGSDGVNIRHIKTGEIVHGHD